jgi:shikimate 5-dehydrogenase
MMMIECVKYAPDKLVYYKNKQVYREYRLDFYSNLQDIDFSSFGKRSILTYRGIAPNAELVKKMFSSRALVDLDINELEQYRDLIVEEKLIFSTHMRTFNEEEILSFLSHKQKARYLKLIFEADTFSEIVKTKDMIDRSGRKNVIFNVTGKWALMQRSLYSIFASQACYFAAEEPLYESQTRKHDLLPILTTWPKLEAKRYLIVGGSGVNDSGSIQYGNKLFYGNRIPKVYIPIPAGSFPEALEAIEFIRKCFAISGIAVTNPYKADMAGFFDSRLSAINTIQLFPFKHDRNFYHGKSDSFVYMENTDIKALEICIDTLLVNREDSILLYGSGACADVFIAKLKRMGYTNLFIMGRNPDSVTALQQKHHIAMHSLPKYNLLINTSPLGQDKTDNVDDLPRFDKLINLPISREENQLEQIARIHKLPMVNSIGFWFMQFEQQIQCFSYPEIEKLDIRSFLEKITYS